MKINWLPRPEEHDYAAAESYLRLVMPPAVVEDLVIKLRVSEVEMFKAKDIIRASYLKPLDEKNRHVAKDLEKIRNEEPVSPVLLVRNTPLTIADGWHRCCALYMFDEDVWVHGVLV